MATDFKTSAAKAFREHNDQLVDSIQESDLPVLGSQFYSRHIISRETMGMVGNVSTSRVVRVSKLMLAVITHLDVHPDKFESALDVFREKLVYAEIASMIALCFGKSIRIITFFNKCISTHPLEWFYWQHNTYYLSVAMQHAHTKVRLQCPKDLLLCNYKAMKPFPDLCVWH